MTQYPVSKARIVECYRAAQTGKRIATNIWHSPFWTPDQFFRWFTSCLDNRINRDDPRQQWRKMQPDYQRDLFHDARIIADYGRRMRNSGCRNILSLPELKARFPHIDSQPKD